MWFSEIINRLDQLTDGNGILCVVTLVCGVLLLVALLVACLCKSQSLYAGMALLLVGVIEGGIFVTDTAVRAAAFFRSLTWIIVGALWLLSALIITLARRVVRRKKRLILNGKRNFDLLPEKDNSYVRDRLHTALRVDDSGEFLRERKSVPYENRGLVRLGYARKLLAQVQDAHLSPAERLETEMLAQSFIDYASYKRWDAEQLRAVNELFSRLLKLAAKYSVGE